MTLTDSDISVIVTSAILLVSEFLPFVTSIQGNGILQILALFVARLTSTPQEQSQSEPNELSGESVPKR